MRKLFAICCLLIAVCGAADGATRVATTATRNATAARTAAPARATTARTATPARATTARTATPARATTARTATAPRGRTTAARAATTPTTQTRTGAEYDQCKSAYFDCMDQFCALKNDDYRRCSCSDDVYALQDTDTVLQEANAKLTEFTEGLDAVGLTASQATSMRVASEGENALTADTSASKALLQAIINSIRGEDTSVGGKFTDLNSIQMSFDPTHAFGTLDAGQTIAAYNGANLYSAIYGQCRSAVANDCNDASLQRAVTAYLMAIEQDCNSVRTSVAASQQKLTAAVREGDAMLDLARIENRQKHNSDDMATCMANVESAILSEEVCGKNYHKCLDNGEFIDITTGAPIVGVVNFYELEHLLTFNQDRNIPDQNLSKIHSNRTFVTNFENRVKKFAEPALDKCTDDAAAVWTDYLDKAMVDIYYAQKAKVAEIKQGCFDFVASCYVNADGAVTAAMSGLTSDAAIGVQPDRIALNDAVCAEYVASCDNMFDGNIVAQYVDDRETTDTVAACRAVAKQCFDKYGGTQFENFFNPGSGLFDGGNAWDWFTLRNTDGEYKSECAKLLADTEVCSDDEMVEYVFGGMDKMDDKKWGVDGVQFAMRATGVATEVFNQINDILNSQCAGLDGMFVTAYALETTDLASTYHNDDNRCIMTTAPSTAGGYNIGDAENMCPSNYNSRVNTESWGACLCWENGGRRSRWGQSVSCMPELPVNVVMDSADCTQLEEYGEDEAEFAKPNNPESDAGSVRRWCTQMGRCDYDQLRDAYGSCPGPTGTYGPDNSHYVGGGDLRPPPFWPPTIHIRN